MANNKKIAVIGECMIELRPELSAAGDSFNAGCLSARLHGASPLLASTVVQHRGAIIPRKAMQAVYG